MTASAALHNRISEQDYLDGEKLSEVRHEYIDGYVYAMAGASKRHSQITVNFSSLLRQLTRGTPCRIYSADVKVRAVSDKGYFYPDVVLGCEQDDADDYYLEKPCLIVEVLSASTEKRDRREKLLAYMNIPGLQAYLLVAQEKPEVELYYREATGRWWVQVFEALTDAVTLPCVNAKVTLADIYEDVFA